MTWLNDVEEATIKHNLLFQMQFLISSSYLGLIGPD